MMATPRQLPDAISSQISDKFTDLLDHEVMRRKINSVIKDYVNSVHFMKKVREYASMELDSRMFRSAQYWMTTIATALVTSLIGFGIGKFLR